MQAVLEISFKKDWSHLHKELWLLLVNKLSTDVQEEERSCHERHGPHNRCGCHDDRGGIHVMPTDSNQTRIDKDWTQTMKRTDKPSEKILDALKAELTSCIDAKIWKIHLAWWSDFWFSDHTETLNPSVSVQSLPQQSGRALRNVKTISLK